MENSGNRLMPLALAALVAVRAAVIRLAASISRASRVALVVSVISSRACSDGKVVRVGALVVSRAFHPVALASGDRRVPVRAR